MLRVDIQLRANNLRALIWGTYITLFIYNVLCTILTCSSSALLHPNNNASAALEDDPCVSKFNFIIDISILMAMYLPIQEQSFRKSILCRHINHTMNIFWLIILNFIFNIDKFALPILISACFIISIHYLHKNKPIC